jgi:hypothetical protein
MLSLCLRYCFCYLMALQLEHLLVKRDPAVGSMPPQPAGPFCLLASWSTAALAAAVTLTQKIACVSQVWVAAGLTTAHQET